MVKGDGGLDQGLDKEPVLPLKTAPKILPDLVRFEPFVLGEVLKTGREARILLGRAGRHRDGRKRETRPPTS